jgi:hypothetical protein
MRSLFWIFLLATATGPCRGDALPLSTPSTLCIDAHNHRVSDPSYAQSGEPPTAAPLPSTPLRSRTSRRRR